MDKKETNPNVIRYQKGGKDEPKERWPTVRTPTFWSKGGTASGGSYGVPDPMSRVSGAESCAEDRVNIGRPIPEECGGPTPRWHEAAAVVRIEPNAPPKWGARDVRFTGPEDQWGEAEDDVESEAVEGQPYMPTDADDRRDPSLKAEDKPRTIVCPKDNVEVMIGGPPNGRGMRVRRPPAEMRWSYNNNRGQMELWYKEADGHQKYASLEEAFELFGGDPEKMG